MRKTKPERKNKRDRRGPLERATALLVASFRSSGSSEAEAREKVTAAVKKALEGEREWVRSEVLPGQSVPEAMLSSAGVFRMVFATEGIDRADQRAQESVFETVRRQLDKELGDR